MQFDEGRSPPSRYDDDDDDDDDDDKINICSTFPMCVSMLFK
jgi:hypothetical protein